MQMSSANCWRKFPFLCKVDLSLESGFFHPDRIWSSARSLHMIIFSILLVIIIRIIPSIIIRVTTLNNSTFWIGCHRGRPVSQTQPQPRRTYGLVDHAPRWPQGHRCPLDGWASHGAESHPSARDRLHSLGGSGKISWPSRSGTMRPASMRKSCGPYY